MSSISSAGEVYHTIDAGERGSVTTIAVRIKFLLGEDVSTRLAGERNHDDLLSRDSLQARFRFFDWASTGAGVV